MSLVDRRKFTRPRIAGLLFAWGLLAPLTQWCGALSAAEGTHFVVTLSPEVARKPLTGRLLVLVSRTNRQPLRGPNWFRPDPFFGLDVTMRPRESVTVDDTSASFPKPLSRLPAGRYFIQAVLHHNPDSHSHAQGAGNLYSAARQVDFPAGRATRVPITLDQVVRPQPFRQTPHIKEIVFKSELLSQALGREVTERAAVVLPVSYFAKTPAGQPPRRYPVIFSVPGFGGTHHQAQRYTGRLPRPGEGEEEFIRVMLSGTCRFGHHVYADSATNGPRGQFLVDELIPYIDKNYRTVAEAGARFLNGHSSGGWSVLWLQVTYPDVFGGVWSLAPDPVDFRDFQQVNLYADPPENMYRDADGKRRPIARRGDTPVLWYDSFCRMDDCLGRGGQLHSFEAAFSPLDEDGRPRRLWDRQTGQIDPEVARTWQKYDIGLQLERHWDELGPKLQGKLHIITGTRDTFYLEGGVERLAERLKRLGSDADVQFIAGADHSSIITPGLFRRVRLEMSQVFRKRNAGNK